MSGEKKQLVVISTRTIRPGDEEIAKEHDIRLESCPALYYRWITPSSFICESVIKEPLPDAWVFTSWRGVEGWWRVWRGFPKSEKIRDSEKLETTGTGYEVKSSSGKSKKRINFTIPKVYVVGDKTGSAFRETFSGEEPVETRSADEHNGMALGFLMAQDGIRSAVHFCAVDRRSELRDVCRKFNVELDEVEVYRSSPVIDPEPVTEPVDAILFFSPNGVSVYSELYGLPDGDWKPVAIGNTTAEEVKRVTGRDPIVAPTPSFRDMIKLVRDRL